MNGQWVPYNPSRWESLTALVGDVPGLQEAIRDASPVFDETTEAILAEEDADLLLIHLFGLTCVIGPAETALGVDLDDLAPHVKGSEWVLAPLPDGRAFTNALLPPPPRPPSVPAWVEETRDLGWHRHQRTGRHQHGGRLLVDPEETAPYAADLEDCVVWMDDARWHVYAAPSGIWHRQEVPVPFWRRWLSWWLGPAFPTVTHTPDPCGCALCERATAAHEQIRRG